MPNTASGRHGGILRQAAMTFDPSLAASIAEKVLLVFVGALATWLLERRARLVAFYGHVGAFRR